MMLQCIVRAQRVKGRREASNDDIKAYKGGKDALKGDTDAFTDSDENVVLKSNEEALKGNGEAKKDD